MQYRLGGAQHELFGAVAVCCVNGNFAGYAQCGANALEGVFLRLALFNTDAGHAHALIPHGVGANGCVLGGGALDDGGVLAFTENLNELLSIDVLRGQTRAHHVIGGVHQLNSGTGDVSVHLTVGGKGGFTRCQVYQVHDECYEQTAVAGVLAGNDLHELRGISNSSVFGVGQLCCRLDKLLNSRGGGLFGHANDLGQQLLGGKFHTLCEPVSLERLGKLCQLRGGAHTGEHTHRGQRNNGFGLGVAILVVAVRCINRDAACLLVLEASNSLLGGGVHLNRQGCINRKDLKEEREPVGGTVRAQETGGLSLDQFVERGLGAVNGCAGGSSRMRTNPHLSLGLLGGYGHATHASENFAGTPRIILNLVF